MKFILKRRVRPNTLVFIRVSFQLLFFHSSLAGNRFSTIDRHLVISV